MGERFNTQTLALMPIAIVINIVIGHLVQSILKLPIYLDSIGTVLIGVLAGPLAGGLTGLLSNIIWGFFAPVAAWFAPVALVIGLLAGFFGSRSWFRKFHMVVLGGIITGIVAAAISAPIVTYVFGGTTGGGTDALVAIFQNFRESVLEATLLQGGISDPFDKTASFLVVFLILKGLPRRLLVRFPQGEKTAQPRRKPLIGRVE